MDHELIMEMIRYYKRQPSRIQHFIKVYTFAKMMGEMEGLDPALQRILEVAAVVHDIGIRPSEEKYGDSNGSHQEKEGPPVARNMLVRLGYDDEVVDRVCCLVGHHHTYDGIDGMDYQILVEADFLVNLYENDAGAKAVSDALDRVFVTKTGKDICINMFFGAENGRIDSEVMEVN